MKSSAIPEVHAFEAIFGASDDCVIWYQDASHIRWCSPIVSVITGIDSSAIVKDPKLLTDAIHPDDHERFLSFLSIDTYPPSDTEIGNRIIRFSHEAETQWVLVTHTPLDQKGFIGFYLTLRDVTEYVRESLLSAALIRISELAILSSNLNELYIGIKDILGTLMPVPNFYIALSQPDTEEIDFPYFFDVRDGDHPRSRKKLKGLTEYVLQTQAPLLAHPADLEKMVNEGTFSPIGSMPIDWMGVPLQNADRTFGVMALQSYDENIRYSNRDLDLLSFASRNIALAIDRKQNEYRLRLAEEKFSKAFQSSPEAIAITKIETGEFIDVNRAFENLFNTPRSEMIGKTSLEIGIWDTGDDRQQLIDTLRARGQARNLEFRFGRNTPRVIHGVLSSDRIEIYGIDCALTTIRDITRQKEAEQKLRMKEDLLSRMLDMLPVGVWLTDDQGRIIRSNPAAHRIWAGAFFVGPNQYNLYKAWTLPDHKALKTEDWAAYKAVRQGESTIEEELEIECFDGSMRIIRNSALPLRDNQGKILGAIVVNHDITDIKRVQSELRTSNEFLQTLIDAIPNALFNKTVHGTYIGCNRAFESLVGYNRTQIIGRTDEELFGADNAKIYTHMDSALITSGGQISYESPYVNRFDVQRDLLVSKAVYSTEDTESAGIIGVITDITERKAAEVALKQSEGNLRALLQSTLEGFILFDANLKIITFNQMADTWARRFTGIELVENETIDQFLPNLPSDSIPNALHDALNDHPRSFSRQIISESGEAIWFDFNALPVKSPLGDVVGACISINDNSELEKAHARVRHLSSALEQSAIMVFILDLEGKIEFINRQVEEKTGYSEDDLIGQSLSVFYFEEPDWIVDMVHSVHSTARNLHTETLVQPRHGDPFWASITVSPIRDQDNRISHFLVQKEDISERKLREATLNQSEAKYRELFETAPYGIIILDVNHSISDVNRTMTRIIGSEKQVCFGSNLRNWVIERMVEEYDTAIEHMELEGSSQIELPLRHQNGSEVWVELSATAILDETGIYGGAIIHCLDISIRRQIELQLRHAQKMESIGQLAAGIAHEINTPTQFVSDNLRFLSDSFGDLHKLIISYNGLYTILQEKQEEPEMLESIEQLRQEIDLDFILSDIPQAFAEATEGVGRITRIVKAMKEFSHPETDQKSATDINHAIESTVTVARNEWKYVAELELNLDPELPLVPCLPGELNQVILNLVINAAHAIEEAKEKRGDREKGLITVSTSVEVDWAVIRITDTGTGIPNTIRNRIFDPFFTTKRVGRGTGQGLAISHSVIVDKHHGKLHFTTEENVGTTFIIELPLIGDEQSNNTGVSDGIIN
jgi:PAS domain S-box-containing protein